jgi:hypothetical protein
MSNVQHNKQMQTDAAKAAPLMPGVMHFDQF